MEVSSAHQMNVFAIYVLVGIICGIFFDVQRSIRKAVTAGNVRTLFEDLLFTIVCISVIAVAGFLFNRGKMRYYQILGVISGALLYSAFLSSFTMIFLKCLYCAVKKVFVIPTVKIIKILIVPPVKTAEFLKRKIIKLKTISRRAGSKIKTKVKHIKKRVKML